LIKHLRVYSNNIVRSCIVLLALLFATLDLPAGEIQHAKVQHKKGVYILELDVVVASRYEPVLALVTDYEHLNRISEVLIETSLISEANAEIKRRRLVVKTCILVFCFTARMVEDVWEKENTIITKIIPELSDYKFGKTEWRVERVDAAHSRITLYCELEPSFWIPPLVGPFLVKQKMMAEAKKTIDRIEVLASDG
jgi:hypothetical protein